MGWTRKTKAGTWRANYRDPEQKTVSKTFAKKGDAERWLRTYEGKIDGDEYVDPRAGRTPMSECWTAFMEGSDLRPSTRAVYEIHWRLHIAPTFGRRAVGSIRPADVRAWRTELQGNGVGASTVKAATKLLKAIFTRAIDDELIARSPARGIKNPSTDPPGGLRVLEAAEVARLVDAHPERYQALVLLLAYRGLRIGEAAGLRVGDLDLLRGRLTISRTVTEVGGQLIEGPPKTDSGRRTITLPAFVRDALAEHLARFSDPSDPTARVFVGPNGADLRANNFRKRIFYLSVEAAGLGRFATDDVGRQRWDGPSPHDLRDTAATLAFSHGATIKEVSGMLGHSNASVTLNRYTGVLASMEARTDARLDAAFRELAADPAASVRPLATSAVVSLPDRAAEQAL